MKWIKLKIYQGEALLSEVEQVESKYDNLINQVRCADLNDNQAKIEFLSFREEIEQRINDSSGTNDLYKYKKHINEKLL